MRPNKDSRTLRHEKTEHTIKTSPCSRYEGKIGEERHLVIFRDIPMNNHINRDSTRPFYDF